MDHLSKLSILAIPFSVVISVCYLWGYWGTFDVDVFSFLTASDIIVLSIVPLLGVGVFSVIGLVIGYASRNFEDKTVGSKNNKVIAVRKGIKLFDKVILVIIVLTVFFGGPSKWLILPMLFAMFVTALVLFSGLIKINSSNFRNQIMLIFVITLLPFQAYGYGKNKALRIEDGNNYKYVINEISGLEYEEKNDLRYLGKAGNDIFIYNASNLEIIVITRDSINPLRLKVFKKYDAKKDKPNE